MYRITARNRKPNKNNMKTKKQHKGLLPSLLGKVGVGLLCGLMTSCNNGAKDAKMLNQLTEGDVQISRIDPTDWYVGMKEDRKSVV